MQNHSPCHRPSHSFWRNNPLSPNPRSTGKDMPILRQGCVQRPRFLWPARHSQSRHVRPRFWRSLMLGLATTINRIITSVITSIITSITTSNTTSTIPIEWRLLLDKDMVGMGLTSATMDGPATRQRLSLGRACWEAPWSHHRDSSDACSGYLPGWNRTSQCRSEPRTAPGLETWTQRGADPSARGVPHHRGTSTPVCRRHRRGHVRHGTTSAHRGSWERPQCAEGGRCNAPRATETTAAPAVLVNGFLEAQLAWIISNICMPKYSINPEDLDEFERMENKDVNVSTMVCSEAWRQRFCLSMHPH